MNVADLKALYDYGHWANEKIRSALSRLGPGQFRQAVPGCGVSLRDTLVHVVSAEWGWLSRCGGAERGPALEPADYPTVDSLAQVWRRVEADVRDFLDGLEDQDLDRTVAYRNPRGEERAMALGELLHHAATHGVHHRGQVTLLLRVLGSAPGNVDLLFHYAEKRGVPAW